MRPTRKSAVGTKEIAHRERERERERGRRRGSKGRGDGFLSCDGKEVPTASQPG